MIIEGEFIKVLDTGRTKNGNRKLKVLIKDKESRILFGCHCFGECAEHLEECLKRTKSTDVTASIVAKGDLLEFYYHLENFCFGSKEDYEKELKEYQHDEWDSVDYFTDLDGKF